ncbi:hypothetical protein ACWD25_02275 [Streptomyces sp. NPDC002920]
MRVARTPEIPPAPDRAQATRTSFTSPAPAENPGAAGAKAGEEPLTDFGSSDPTCAVRDPDRAGGCDEPSRPVTPTTRKTTESGEQVSTSEIDAAVQQLAARGIRAMPADEWTYQRALDVVRESRRRQAGSPIVRKAGQWGDALADDISQATGADAADIAAVLLYASSWVGGLAMMQGLGRDTSLSVLSCAAAELDRRANSGETS